MRIFFEELFERLDSIELAGEPRRTNSNFVGGVKSVPVKFSFHRGDHDGEHPIGVQASL